MEVKAWLHPSAPLEDKASPGLTSANGELKD